MTPYLHIVRARSGNLRASLYVDCDFCGQPKGPASVLLTRVHQHDVDRIFTEDTARHYCEALLEQHK